jgi:hypothetical protein
MNCPFEAVDTLASLYRLTHKKQNYHRQFLFRTKLLHSAFIHMKSFGLLIRF